MFWSLRKSRTRRIESAGPARQNEAGVPKPNESSTAPFDGFMGWAQTLGSTATIVEIGTKQSAEGESTHMHGSFPAIARENYIMVDIEDGEDVDIVADLHHLPSDWTGRFDGVVAGAVFEHLERPWLAANEVARVLKPGGCCYINTHQTFPLHGFPSDFFRFSKEALSLIFADAGMAVLEVAYEHRTLILPEPDVMSEAFARDWNQVWPSYLCVNLFGAKPGHKETSNGEFAA